MERLRWFQMSIGFGMMILSFGMMNHALARSTKVESHWTGVVGEGKSIRVWAVAHYPFEPDEVYHVLQDIDRHKDFFPRVIDSKYVKATARGKTVWVDRARIDIDVPFPLKNMWTLISVRRFAQDREMRWTRLAGNLQRNKGRVVITPNEYGSRLEIDVEVRIRSGFPQWIIGWGAKKYLPNLLRALGGELERRNYPRIS